MDLSFSCFIFLHKTTLDSIESNIIKREAFYVLSFKIDFFSTFTTGCDFRKYENEIKQKLYIKLIYKE